MRPTRPCSGFLGTTGTGISSIIFFTAWLEFEGWIPVSSTPPCNGWRGGASSAAKATDEKVNDESSSRLSSRVHAILVSMSPRSKLVLPQQYTDSLQRLAS